jgi:hypothetical protein
MLVTDAATRTVQNLGYADNEVATTVIPSGGLVVPAAPRGADAPASSRGYIAIEERTVTNVSAGTFTAGAYSARLMNTVVHDTLGDLIGLNPATGIFTLKGGRTYEFRAESPAYDVRRHKARLRNVDTGVAIIGTSEYSAAGGGQTHSRIEGRFTISVDTQFVIEHRCQQTQAVNGRGIASNLGQGSDFEKFGWIELWTVAS